MKGLSSRGQGVKRKKVVKDFIDEIKFPQTM